MTTDWIDDARNRLIGLRQGPGVWGYRLGSTPAVEASTLACLALLATDPKGVASRSGSLATARWLASIQRPDGSLGVTTALPEPGWTTPHALLVWSNVDGFEAERAKGLGWLLALKGTTVVKGPDDPTGHDATIVGWPWVADTHSWVEPSATALLAIAREGKADHPRVAEGVRLIRDRAIPSGGWNLGNPVVFGTALRPLPGPTGLALLALARLDKRSKIVDQAQAYLRGALAETLAPISMGWGLLGLRAWRAEPVEAATWLASAYAKAASRPLKTVELALLLLAVGNRSLELLGLPNQAEEAAPHA